MKTNRQLNKDHAGRELLKVRPKQPAWDFKSLEAVIRQWITQAK
jgi:hypothetical protein